MHAGYGGVQAGFKRVGAFEAEVWISDLKRRGTVVGTAGEQFREIGRPRGTGGRETKVHVFDGDHQAGRAAERREAMGGGDIRAGRGAADLRVFGTAAKLQA